MKRMFLAVAAVSLLLVTGCGFGGDGTSVTETVTVTAGEASIANQNVTPGKVLPQRKPSHDLRATVEKFTQDGIASETTGSPTFKELMATYAVPMCGQILNGFADAFGTDDQTTSEPSESPDIIEVTENGANGTVVTREADGEQETTYWLFDGSSWRFTCEGIFDTENSE